MSYRQTLFSLLETLGSRKLQEEYEAEVPIASVPAELICGWFDDQYHPRSTLFRAAFSECEGRILADFDAVFRAEVDAISAAGVAQLWSCPGWPRVSAAAAFACGLLRVNEALGEET